MQVWFREGIHPRVPEGTSWEEVEVPKEVAQLSAGPGDLLWALLWDGNLMVRTGLSLDSPTGQHLLWRLFVHNFLQIFIFLIFPQPWEWYMDIFEIGMIVQLRIVLII